ncbi:hypothetical protein [Corallococcus llansteffanensis]|uniref:Uncharacterized protein n=1 Tax=Corallococcus llansteffanensis TaxID=2316731 RepID=A0A3A8NKI1_9BACT|nr:hypothetical protein [Corallococcus llansteffanensis]RKH44493.1 hypothetical protein D7V93_36155 [Corallococcus llansteffanensis]
MFISDPERFISQKIILMGGSISAQDLVARKADLVSYEGQPLSFGATEGRHRVFLKYWYQEPEASSDSDEEPDPEWEKDKAELQALRGYTLAPRTFGWTNRNSVTIISPPPDIFLSAHDFQLGGNEGGQGKRAYLLPWHEDGVCWMQLGDDANFFFTDAMTGCTFGVGGDPRRPVVLHSNVGASDKRTSQTAEHLKYVIKKLPVGAQASPVTLYGKERQYMSDLEKNKTQRPGFTAAGTNANIVGWREKGEWQFWSQRYMLYTGVGSEQRTFADIVVEQIEY